MKVENEYVKIDLIDGMLDAKYKPIYITIDIAKEVLRTRIEFTQKDDLPMLLNTSDLKGIDKESRDFFSNPEGSIGLTAVALMVETRYAKWLVSFLLGINIKKKIIPIKVFADKEKAKSWLSNY